MTMEDKKQLKMKTKDVASAYHILENAKYQKLSDDDKVKVWKLSRLLKPFADSYDADNKDAQQKFIPDNSFTERLVKAQQYETCINKGDSEAALEAMSKEDYDTFLSEFVEYHRLIMQAVSEYGNKEVELEFDALTEDSFGKLLSSNDWTLKQAEQLDFIIG